MKLTALGLGITVALAMSALVVVSASATTPVNSHFTSEAAEHHLILRGTENYGTAHQVKLHPESGSPLTCTTATYHGTLSGPAATTTQAIQLRPNYLGCSTESGAHGEMAFDVPSNCGTNFYEFTSGSPGTLHFNCPTTLTHPNCSITFPVQTSAGVNYDTITRNNKHALTVTVNTTVTTHYEGGICVFLGTGHTWTMTGAFTVWGENTVGAPVGITAT